MACFISLAGGYASLCLAETNTQIKATVSLSTLPDCKRVIFSWSSKKKIPFTVDTYGKHVKLHFSRPVALEWDTSFKNLHPFIRDIQTSKNGETIILTLDEPTEVRSFLDYNKNGIDLVVPKNNWPKNNGPKNKMPIATLTVPHEKSKKPVTVATNKVPVATNKITITPAPASVAAPTTNVIAQEIPSLAALSPSAGSNEEAAKASAATATPQKETPAKTDKAPPAADASPAIPPKAAADKDAIDLPLKEDEPLAVFIRQKKLWLVASATAQISPDVLHKAGTIFIKSAKKLDDPQATILVAPLESNVSASIEKTQQHGLRLVLQPGPGKLLDSLLPSIHLNNTKQSFIALQAGNAQQVVSLHDPVSGEEIRVVPLSTAGSGVSATHAFAEFNLLPSAQGIIIQPLSNDLNIEAAKGIVAITSPKGLSISAELAKQIEDAETDALNAHTPSTLFPYMRWKIDDEKNLVPTELKLEHDIAYGTTDSANKARLKLLGLYLSEGLFIEARGMADNILRSSYKFYRDNKVSALRGASYFFMYRFLEAERDFSAPELMNNPEAGMWRALCKELLGEDDGTEKFSFLANYDHIISTYPPVFIQKMAIIAADHSISRKEYETAMGIFDALRKDNLDEPVKKYIDYMHAKILSETKGEEEAQKIWELQAANLDDSLTRSRAEFSLVNMLLRLDKITPEEAIRRLEKIRIVWRGDSLELNVLTLLGNLYIEDKEYSKALHTLRDIVLYYSDVPEAVTTAKKMEEVFVDLYNKGGADSMPPLEALSLFYEFRDLVPLGKDGDLMIRNLADRLVGIDLLDRAALLLDHQIRKRLEGEERSRVGARLALVYLLNHQPKEALETLKTTGYGELPSDLQLTRLRLTAQALAQQNQIDKAIDVISSDNSNEGSLLRLTIYWDNKDWPNVVSTAEEILGNRNDPSATLTQQESDVLLKLATAYVYEHDSGQIQYLRDYFTPLLKAGQNKDSFLFITSESGTIDYQTLANLEVDIDAVKSFLDAYRDKVKKNGLSSAIN